jgi:hypothetical protein
VRQNCDCDLNCAYLFGRRQGVSVRTNRAQEKMSSAALSASFFGRALGLWIFFESRRAAGAKNQLTATASPL